VVVVAIAVAAAGARAQTNVLPSKDGTILDEGADGVADTLDATFNNSTPGFEGALTLVRGSNAREVRVFWEYNLASVTLTPPVSATLTFALRGAPVFPLPDAIVKVFAYPADLQETLGDFDAGPTADVGSATVVAFQTPTVYSVNVSGVINEALANGSDRAAFRFQIDSNTPHESNQAFIDALDANPATKPFLTLRADDSLLRHDYDVDGDVDGNDYAQFVGCVSGVGVAAGPGCWVFAGDADVDVDLLDFGDFQRSFTN